MEKKDNHNLLIIIGVILVIILVIMRLNKKEEEVELYEREYTLVDDYSRFFTVDSCVYKYITFVSNKSTSDILNVLDKKYVDDNNITSSNLYNYVGNLDGTYSFITKTIYQEELSDNIIKYYVYGYLTKETIDNNGEKEDYYLIVTLDLENQLFSVTPYDGQIFMEAT